MIQRKIDLEKDKKNIFVFDFISGTLNSICVGASHSILDFYLDKQFSTRYLNRAKMFATIYYNKESRDMNFSNNEYDFSFFESLEEARFEISKLFGINKLSS